MLESELKTAMLQAFRRLPADAQALMRLCTAEPPIGYDEISRAHILEPTNQMAGRPVVWSH